MRKKTGRKHFFHKEIFSRIRLSVRGEANSVWTSNSRYQPSSR